jgi:beta-aspartyl-peptidase (threonine type)
MYPDSPGDQKALAGSAPVVYGYVTSINDLTNCPNPMNHTWSRRAFLSTALATTAAAIVRGAPSQPIAFAIHGGAGVIEKSSMTPEREAQYRLKLTEAVTAGHQVLKRGGTALDAVVTAIVLLEDSGIFNAGKGTVFTSAGTCELNALMMNGAAGRPGPWPASNASKTPSAPRGL